MISILWRVICLSTSEEYDSHNTYCLSVEEIKNKLLQLDYTNDELSNWRKQASKNQMIRKQ
jgi:hypothetical protein